MRSTRPPKEPFDGKKRERNILAPVAYPRPPVTRACCALVPARRSYPSATRARSLFLLVCYSYSSATRSRGVLATPSWRSTSTPATPSWRSTSTPATPTWRRASTPRARALPGVRPRATLLLLVPVPVHVLVPVTALAVHLAASSSVSRADLPIFSLVSSAHLLLPCKVNCLYPVGGSRGPTQIHIRGLCHWAGKPAGHLGAESPSRRTAGPTSARKTSPPCPH